MTRGDPALYVDFLFERRALLFDLGDLERLAPRKILRLTHVFVSHTHMDHFGGFDRVLRTRLHQNATLELFGPPAFVDHVEHELAAYSWNLVRNYPTDFISRPARRGSWPGRPGSSGWCPSISLRATAARRNVSGGRPRTRSLPERTGIPVPQVGREFPKRGARAPALQAGGG